jgi:dephospho-CoA kinase
LKKIGLTGGIGSGKSYIAKMFEALQVPVFYADNEAKKVLNTPAVLDEVGSALKTSVLDTNTGLADRKKIAALVFNDPEKLKLLNGIIHPKVEEAFEQWCKQNTNCVYILKEAAILFESGSYKNLDGVVCVIAPLEIRINRVVKRDLQTKDEILKRINQQWNDEQRKAQSNWLINNDEQHQLLTQVLAVHEEISKL